MDWMYIRFAITALATMLAGAQTVHVLYKPLDDLEELVEIELQKQRERERSGEINSNMRNALNSVEK